MSPLVSVILPTYNRANTVARAAASVLEQTFSDYELLIVDDGSTDETPKVLEKIATHKNVKVIREAHRGVSAARNTGILASQGRYIAFQDSDDEWLPKKLEKSVEMLEGTPPEIGVFYSDMLRIEVDGKMSQFRSPDVCLGGLISEETLDYQVWGIGIQSTLVKRECLDEVGKFDEALPRLTDLDLLIRLSFRYRFLHHREVLVKYYAGRGISTDTRAMVVARRYLLEKYRYRLEENHADLAKQYLFLSVAHSKNRDNLQSLNYMIRAFLISPLGTYAFLRKYVLRRIQKTGENT